jgi:DNA-binding protein YbaB
MEAPMTTSGDTTMDTQQLIRDLAGRLERHAGRTGETVFGVLADGFSGTSLDGLVTVRLSLMGRLRRITLRPGSYRPGDETALGAAVVDAVEGARVDIDTLLTGTVPVKTRRRAERPRDGFTGTSPNAAVTVGLNRLGLLRHVAIRPGKFIAGDEPLIAEAVVKAADAARQMMNTAVAEAPTLRT